MDYDIPKLPYREENSNKGTFGKILNISGSEYMPGAAFLSSVAALRAGAGYVELASCDKVLFSVAAMAPEIVLSPLEKTEELIKSSTVLLIGCGLSTSKDAVCLFNKVIKLANMPAVIDADGLNILSDNFVKLSKNTVLTPHPKEASRLLSCTLDEVLNNMEQSAIDISQKYNCVTVLKSHNTIVTDGEAVYYNKTGNSALAKAGSGDVLAGIISGLLAQKMKSFEAAVLGVYLHGMTADIAKNDLSKYCVLASDLLRYIPYAFQKKLSEEI